LQVSGEARLKLPNHGIEDGSAMEKRIPVVEEQLAVDKRVVDTGKVRIGKTVDERVAEVDLPLHQDEIDIRRVAVNRVVDTPAQTRQEGDTLIVPVHEEVLVRQLVLTEELQITKRTHRIDEPQQVVLRRERVSIERTAAPGPE
jgi:uncharacterized protein (TIGR02271 family)